MPKETAILQSAETPSPMKKRVFEIVVSAVAIIFALVHMVVSDTTLRIDSTTLVLLGIATVPWLFPFLKSFKFTNVFEVEFREQLKEIEQKVDLIEDRGLLPGRSEPAKKHERRSGTTAKRDATSAKEDEWDTDPNKGKFGELPERDGRVLEAKITPAAGPRSAACHVLLSVRSIDPGKPLTGTVTFHLHPTFGRWQKYDVPVENGVAKDNITSWGVFTVGAVADGGKTKLELDLAKVDGGTPKFYTE
jgi:hypothetical protein